MNTWGRPWKDFQGSLLVLFTFLSCEHLATWILSLLNSESPWALLHSLSLCHDLETLLKEWNRALVGMTAFVFPLSRISAFSVVTQCFWKHLIHIFCLSVNFSSKNCIPWKGDCYNSQLKWTSALSKESHDSQKCFFVYFSICQRKY